MAQATIEVQVWDENGDRIESLPVNVVQEECFEHEPDGLCRRADRFQVIGSHRCNDLIGKGLDDVGPFSVCKPFIKRV